MGGVFTNDAEEGGVCLPWRGHRWSRLTGRPWGEGVAAAAEVIWTKRESEVTTGPLVR